MWAILQNGSRVWLGNYPMEADKIMEAMPPEADHFCADCKHLIGVRYHRDDADVAKWRCGHLNNIVETKVNLLTGIKQKLFLREDLHYLRYEDHPDTCGPQGRWWELYEAPTHFAETSNKPAAPKKPSLKGISADDL